MLHSFKNKLNEKRGATSARPRAEEAGPSKKRNREGSNIARTARAAGQMPIPPLARSARPTPPPTDDFNRPIPTGVAVPLATAGGSMLALGDDRSFSRAVSFKLPSNIEGEIRSVPDDDLLDSGIEMICRGPVSYTHLTLPTNREV